jgi:hypothetical protein
VSLVEVDVEIGCTSISWIEAGLVNDGVKVCSGANVGGADVEKLEQLKETARSTNIKANKPEFFILIQSPF